MGSATSHPEIQLFAAGSPDTLDRTVDVAALSSWLAVRAIDRETRRLDSIERGEPPAALPASIPPPAGNASGRKPSRRIEPLSEVPTPGRDPRRLRQVQGQRSASAGCAAGLQCACGQPARCTAAAADRGSSSARRCAPAEAAAAAGADAAGCQSAAAGECLRSVVTSALRGRAAEPAESIQWNLMRRGAFVAAQARPVIRGFHREAWRQERSEEPRGRSSPRWSTIPG